MSHSPWPFGDMAPFSYDLIMADPPWAYENWSNKGEHKNASAKYNCMALEDIMSLPIGHLASPNSVLWLWATNPMLPQALETLEAWGFTYKTAGHWSKKTKHGKQAYTEAEKLIPNARRADIFSRQKRVGWDNWGHEADKFGGGL
jgi:N6-adenosine-specific RNA methylase IME4